ncbi:MAG TPA: MBL fold metallo-hydrolase [Gammaproteobacteria bacterium]|jgi:glyoxylase-like metal-dependent hydrolase (beta-lactamase superfamily II)|nr:MBL fold metallo-hydrolase [Gammaproteobacteria bacterium]
MPNKNLGFGITCIDTEHIRKDMVAAYLIEDSGEVAFVDTGSHLSVPNLLDTLDQKNIAYSDVKYIILTHIHLDHAGGAGQLLKSLPNATVYVHERGARHLVNPKKLREGVIGVYGELFFKQFLGDLIPIPEDRITIASDGDEIKLGTRSLKIIDTPGHARHHVCIWDEKSKGIFSGDTLGVSYREFDSINGEFIFPPTTPVQFEPVVWNETIDNLLILNPDRAYLTHYCMIPFNGHIANKLKDEINNFASIAIKLADSKNRHKDITLALLDHLLDAANKHKVTLDKGAQSKLFKGDLGVCARGLGVWLDQQESLTNK